MKFVILIPIIISASAVTSDISLSRKYNRSNIKGKQGRNVSLRRLKNHHKGGDSDNAEVAEKESGKDQSKSATVEEDHKKKKEGVESTQAVDGTPACPPAYDISKTDYLGGDIVTVTDNIFECNSILVKYCNIGEWDDALSADNPNAEYFWSDAWVHVGPCSISAIISEPASLHESESAKKSITHEEKKHGKATAKEVREKKEEKVKSEKAKTKGIKNESVTGAATADDLVSTPLVPPTPKPTSLPTLPLAVSPTSAPYEAVESTQVTDGIPTCPPAYDITKTDYLGGDTVTITDNIFECHSLYVIYCNIGEWDDTLLAQDANAEELWSGAWVYIGPCSSLAVVSESTSLPTFSPTLVPSIEVASVQAADAIPACPPAYDIVKTDYHGGDTVTITGNIFECHSLNVMYCNIGEWDDALMAQDANAEELWSGAWVYIGPCV